MAISTYSELLTAIEDWADRPDLTSYIPDFVTLTTAMFNVGQQGIKPIRTREMEEVAVLSPTSGVFTIPTDYLQYRRVVELASMRRELRYIAPSYAEQYYPDRPSGQPNDFTIVGTSLYAFPTTSNDIEMTYYQQIPNLSVSNTTNWLLTKAPHIYLHGGLMQLAMFINDNDLLQRSTAILVSAIDGLNQQDEMGNYARAAVRMSGIRP